MVALMVGVGLFSVLALLMLAGLVLLYNALVRLRNTVRNAWSQIDVQLKRRADLIPNLVKTVQGYAGHESETLVQVTQARDYAGKQRSPAGRMEAEGLLSQALVNLMAVSERYPELKADQNFRELQEELTSTENRIAFARQFYNDSVMTYHNMRESFPSNMIAGAFSFQEEPLWRLAATDAAHTAPVVAFGDASRTPNGQ